MAGKLDPRSPAPLYEPPPARWQSGDAEDCKSSYSGSIPLRPSTLQILVLQRFPPASTGRFVFRSCCTAMHAKTADFLALPAAPGYSLQTRMQHDVRMTFAPPVFN